MLGLPSFVAAATLVAAPPADTVVVPRSVLLKALANPAACRSPDADRGFWDPPVTALQTGRAIALKDGRVALVDLEAKLIRIFSPAGKEIARVGGRGSGPGEFSAFVTLSRWAGDTIAVQDFPAARISLFTTRGFAAAISLGEIATLATGGLMGQLSDQSLVFGAGLDPGTPPQTSSIFRGRMKLVRWRRGDPAVRELRNDLLGPEWQPIRINGKSGSLKINLGRTTSIATIGPRIVVYDDAAPRVTLLDSDGVVTRVVAFEVDDPIVSTTDRDTVREANAQRFAKQPPPPAIRQLFERFPKTRPAALWGGVDAEEGFWLAFQQPVAVGAAVFLRFTANGTPTRCYRRRPDERVVAFGADRLVTMSTQDDQDAINVRRAAEFPR